MEWQLLSTVGKGPNRYGHSAIYSKLNRSLMIFGGQDKEKQYNDIVVFQLDTLTWTYPQITGSLPSPRYFNYFNYFNF